MIRAVRLEFRKMHRLRTGLILVLLVIAVSLAWLAFKPQPETPGGDLEPDGAAIGSEVAVERRNVANTLNLDGTITAQLQGRQR